MKELIWSRIGKKKRAIPYLSEILRSYQKRRAKSIEKGLKALFLMWKLIWSKKQSQLIQVRSQWGVKEE